MKLKKQYKLWSKLQFREDKLAAMLKGREAGAKVAIRVLHKSWEKAAHKDYPETKGFMFFTDEAELKNLAGDSKQVRLIDTKGMTSITDSPEAITVKYDGDEKNKQYYQNWWNTILADSLSGGFTFDTIPLLFEYGKEIKDSFCAVDLSAMTLQPHPEDPIVPITGMFTGADGVMFFHTYYASTSCFYSVDGRCMYID